MNNHETYVLTGNRFNTFLVLIFSDLNKTQVYKMPYRDSPHHEIRTLMSFNCLYLLKAIGHKKDYQKANHKKFLFEVVKILLMCKKS